jgi:Pyruvate/2-oxoacid:ferredoxin oxidoreductase gamma subunit
MATTYKVLGQTNPSSTANANLYTVPSGTSTVISTLVITNVTATVALARVYVRQAGVSATTNNAIAYDVSVPANSLNTFTLGITMGATDVLTVNSATADALAFHLFGSEVS